MFHKSNYWFLPGIPIIKDRVSSVSQCWTDMWRFSETESVSKGFSLVAPSKEMNRQLWLNVYLCPLVTSIAR